MSYSGQLYGVVLNDSRELGHLASEFSSKPYLAAPKAPVVYMKPSCTVSRHSVPLPQGHEVVVSSTLALLFSRDASRCDPMDAMAHVGAICLALEMSLPQRDYYRPAIPYTIRESSMALGEWVPVRPIDAITTHMGGVPVHSWELDRLHRKPAHLISELSQFMSLKAGDVLLVGLPGDAPVVSGEQTMTVSAANMPTLDVRLVEEAA